MGSLTLCLARGGGGLIHFIKTDDDSGDDILCPCERPNRQEDMIGCDGVKWYHLSCVGTDIKNVPGGEWLCISCR